MVDKKERKKKTKNSTYCCTKNVFPFDVKLSLYKCKSFDKSSSFRGANKMKNYVKVFFTRDFSQ